MRNMYQHKIQLYGRCNEDKMIDTVVGILSYIDDRSELQDVLDEFFERETVKSQQIDGKTMLHGRLTESIMNSLRLEFGSDFKGYADCRYFYNNLFYVITFTFYMMKPIDTFPQYLIERRRKMTYGKERISNYERAQKNGSLYVH